MGMSKYVRESFRASAKQRTDFFRKRLSIWRRQQVVVRAEKPTNPVRARELGYKARKDFIIARVRIKRGKRKRRKPDLGRKPGKRTKKVNPGRELGWYAEQKALRKYRNLQLVNSYWVGEDGVYKYFEVILQDRGR